MVFFNNNIYLLTNIILAIVIILISKIIGPFLAYIFIKMFNFKEKNKIKIKNNAFYKPVSAFIFVLGIYTSTFLFTIPSNIKLIITKIFRISIILIIAKGFSNLFNINSETFLKIRKKLSFSGNDTLVNFFSKILKLLVYIISGFIIVSEFGYDLGGLVTGLGISSVVVALAAQDLAKSLFGGLCIILDKPFSIGDYILVNNFEGTVEDITFRTTRIRNVNNELIILPNSQITGDYITNLSKRDSRRYELLLTLELSTPLDKVNSLKQDLINLLSSHDDILKENIRVFFDTISDNGINIKISCYTNISNFLQFKENLNFEILNLLESKNIELAYDSKTIYLKK